VGAPWVRVPRAVRTPKVFHKKHRNPLTRIIHDHGPLLDTVRAVHMSSRFARSLDSGQQQGNQISNNANHHEELAGTL